MEFTLMSGIGDQLAATAVFRELKQRLPDENLRIYEPYHPELWKNNPHLNRGNHENGVRMRLSSPGGGERISEHYARSIRTKLGWKEEFNLVDDTPELFLTEDERKTNYNVSKTRGVAINVDAGWTTRRWPYFKDLANALLQRGWEVYWVGHDNSETLPCTRSFHNALSVRQTAVLLSQCARVACNDTGLMHLAAAVGTPCAVAFGHIPAAERVYKTTRGPRTELRCNKTCSYLQCWKSFTRCAKLDQISMLDMLAAVVQ